MLTDTHPHIYISEFDDDRDSVIERSIGAGVDRIMMPNIDVTSAENLLKTAARYPSVCFPLMGLHPTSVGPGYIRELDQVLSILEKGHFYGIGETGMDLYWDTTYAKEQEDAFRQQIRAAGTLNLPLVIHVRNSFSEVISVLEKENDRNLSGIFHCFSGTIEEATRIINAGFYLGIGGVVTYRNSRLPEVLEKTGPERLVLETDSPWLTPVPKRGTRNESSYMVYSAEKVAEIFGMTLEEISGITTANANTIFNLVEDHTYE
jgi:TatD DNase family protein